MSDEFPNDVEKEKLSPEEIAFQNAVYVRKVITDALMDPAVVNDKNLSLEDKTKTLGQGNLSCLPGPDGLADTKPAVNLVNGTYYHGANMLYLKEHQKQNGYPSAEYLTFDQVSKAREEDKSIAIRAGEKGVSVNFSEFNDETNKWENKTVRLFNVAQTTKPQELKDWAEQKQVEKAEERIAYLQSQYGTSYQPPEAKQKGPGPEIACTSTEPEKYLGQYLAAVSMGGTFKASPEQAKEFAEKLHNSVYQKMENGHTNPFKLSKISNEASKECKEVIKEMKMESKKLNQEQKLEQQQTRGGRSF